MTDTASSIGPLSSATDYFWRVRAKNTGGVSAFSAVSTFKTEGVVHSFSILDGWNLLSLPVETGNGFKTLVFPTAISQAFKFTNAIGYTAQDTLSRGIGYWIKFDQAQTVNVTGLPIISDSVAMTAGWNLIGTISTSVPVSSITSEPPGIVASLFYAYTGSYVDVDTLFPGNAYWVKTNSSGTLLLTPSSPVIRPASELLKR